MSCRFLCRSCWLGWCRLSCGSFCRGGSGGLTSSSGILTSGSGFSCISCGGLSLLLFLVCNFISDLVVVSSDLLFMGLLLGHFIVLFSDLHLDFGALLLLESGNFSGDLLLNLFSVFLSFFFDLGLLLFESVLMVTENFSDFVVVSL